MTRLAFGGWCGRRRPGRGAASRRRAAQQRGERDGAEADAGARPRNVRPGASRGAAWSSRSGSAMRTCGDRRIGSVPRDRLVQVQDRPADARPGRQLGRVDVRRHRASGRPSSSSSAAVGSALYCGAVLAPAASPARFVSASSGVRPVACAEREREPLVVGRPAFGQHPLRRRRGPPRRRSGR